MRKKNKRVCQFLERSTNHPVTGAKGIGRPSTTHPLFQRFKIDIMYEKMTLYKNFPKNVFPINGRKDKTISKRKSDCSRKKKHRNLCWNRWGNRLVCFYTGITMIFLTTLYQTGRGVVRRHCQWKCRGVYHSYCAR